MYILLVNFINIYGAFFRLKAGIYKKIQVRKNVKFSNTIQIYMKK